MDIEEYSTYEQLYTGQIPQLLLSYLDKGVWKVFLDLGCGDGSLLYKLNNKKYFANKQVHAVDLSAKRIELVKNINKDFVCYVGDACNVPEIQDSQIDFLVSEQLIEHVDNDESLVEEAQRMLRQNGTFYLSTVFKKWYGWYFYRCNGKWVIDPTHVREYTHDNQLLELLGKHGFEVLVNKKTLITRSLGDFIARRLRAKRDRIMGASFLAWLRLPILGYYTWEIVARKK